MAKKKLASVTDRILLHLLDYKSFEGEMDGAMDLTQIGISNAVGIARGNVAKAIQPLINDCLVACHKVHVPGFKLKRTIYYLTPQGHAKARELEEALGRATISIVTADGASADSSIADFLAGARKDVALVDIVREANVTRVFDHGDFLRRSRAQPGFCQTSGRAAPEPARFFGRRDELDRVSSWLDTAGGATVLINGMPGIGKTSFLLKLLHTRGDAGTTFFYSIKPWCSLKALLGTLAAFLEEKGQGGLRAYLDGNKAIDLSEVEYLIMRSLADAEGTSLAYDDYHNSPAEVRSFFKVLHRAARESEVNLLVVGRTVEPFYDIKEATPDGQVRELTLEGLDEDSTLTLAKQVGVSGKRLAEIYPRTDGHPLFVELLAMSEFSDYNTDLERFINDEFTDALGSDELDALRYISVHRYAVDRAALASHQRVIPRLTRESILRRAGGDLYELHEIIKSAIYMGLAEDERRRLHAKAAEHYLESGTTDGVMEAIHHLLSAGNELDAANVILDREGRLLRSDRMPELRKALASILSRSMDIDKGERARLFFIMGSAASYTGDWDDALMHYSRAQDMAGGDDRLRMMCKAGAGEISLMRNNYAAAQTLFEEVLDWAGKSGETGLQTEASYYLGSVHERLGDNRAALAHFQTALKCSFLTNDQYQLAMAHYGMGRVFHRNEAYGESLDSKNKALEIALRINNKHLASKILTSIGNTLDRMNRRDDEVRVHEEAIHYARQTGAVRTLAYALSNASAAYMDLTEYDTSLSYMEESERIFTRLGEQHMMATMKLNKGMIYLFKGDQERAFSHFAQCEEILKIINDKHLLIDSYLRFGIVLRDTGNETYARQYFEKALVLTRYIKNKMYEKQIEKEIKKKN